MKASKELYMTSKNDILIELEGIAPLLSAEKHQVPYQVPGEYFTLFADVMLDNIHQTNQSFSVPDGFFEGFATQMIQKVRSQEVQEELNQLAPILNDIPKKMPYFLPEGYFESFEVNREHVTKKEPAKVVSIFGKTLLKWAAAAVVIFTIGFSWIYFSKQTIEPSYATTLSMQDMDSLLNHMEAGNLNNLLEEEGADIEFTNLLIAAQEGVEKSVQNLTTEELNSYLENFSLTIEEGS